MESPLRTRRLASLIDRAYAWADDTSALPGLLRALARSMAARGAVLVHHDLRGRAHVLRAFNCRADVVTQYERTYAALDPLPRSRKVATLARPGLAFLGETLVPYDEMRTTAYDRDWARGHGCSRVLGVGLSLDSSGFTGLVLVRAHEDGPFTRGAVDTLVAFAPHAARAWTLRGRLSRALVIGEAALATLDRRALGLLLVDRRGHVVRANRVAEGIVARCDGLQVLHGTLRAATPSQTERLRALIAAAAGGCVDSADACGGAVAVDRPSGRRRWAVIVRPAPSAPGDLRRDGIAAVVHVADDDGTSAPSEQALRQLYGLTAAEARVASLMAQGASSSAIAAALRYTATTATWYAKRVLAKTGTPTRAAFAAMASALEGGETRSGHDEGDGGRRRAGTGRIRRREREVVRA